MYSGASLTYIRCPVDRLSHNWLQQGSFSDHILSRYNDSGWHPPFLQSRCSICVERSGSCGTSPEIHGCSGMSPRLLETKLKIRSRSVHRPSQTDQYIRNRGIQNRTASSKHQNFGTCNSSSPVSIG